MTTVKPTTSKTASTIATAPGTKTAAAPSATPASIGPQLLDLNRVAPEAAVGQLIDHAYINNASDLFLVTNEQHVAALVRHLGIVRTISVLDAEQGKRCIAHLRNIASMDVAEKRRCADGRWIYHVEEADEDVDLRINSIPTLHGEDLAIRLLSRRSSIFALENLGMTAEQLTAYKSMLASPSGLILITGPTGSGKTATLYSSLVTLNDGKRKINTIENPVEYAIDGLRQSQINPAIGLTFSDLLRSILRQGPDVIMIGEIRDEESAQIAVRAANSGIVVFATLHAASAIGALQSLRGLGINSRFLSTALRGIVAQRLVRTLCPNCKIGFDLSDAPDTFDDLKKYLKPGEGKTLYGPRGCEACNQTGYAGRTGIFEILSVDRGIRHLVGENDSAQSIRENALSQSMLEFRQSAMLKVARGETSTEEVFRVIPSEDILAED
jgi:type II secretory ATPase GspE/PulE/Tfp pilus assembly ATPase PilB-like protein